MCSLRWGDLRDNFFVRVILCLCVCIFVVQLGFFFFSEFKIGREFRVLGKVLEVFRFQVLVFGFFFFMRYCFKMLYNVELIKNVYMKYGYFSEN